MCRNSQPKKHRRGSVGRVGRLSHPASSSRRNHPPLFLFRRGFRGRPRAIDFVEREIPQIHRERETVNDSKTVVKNVRDGTPPCVRMSSRDPSFVGKLVRSVFWDWRAAQIVRNRKTNLEERGGAGEGGFARRECANRAPSPLLGILASFRSSSSCISHPFGNFPPTTPLPRWSFFFAYSFFFLFDYSSRGRAVPSGGRRERTEDYLR